MDTNEKPLNPPIEELTARNYRPFLEVFAKITEERAKAEAERWARDRDRANRETERLAEEVKREREIYAASQTQVGGDHYRDFAIQPSEFIHRNGIGFLEGNVIKYVSRHRRKSGRQDIEKAIHYLQLLLEWEYLVGVPSERRPSQLSD